MRNILFILLLLPFALFAQTDWNRSPYDQPAEQEDVSTVDVGAYDQAGQYSANGVPLIEGFSKGWFSTGLLGSKVYMLEGDTIRFDRVETMLADIPKAKDELASSKRWGYASIVFALTAIIGVNVWAYGSSDVSAGGGIATLGGLLLEGYCVRQSNNHYNTAIDIYNARLRGDDKPMPSDVWDD